MKFLKIKELLNFISKRKFLLTGIAFVFWLAFIDQNSLVARIQINKKLKKLKYEKNFYEQKVSEDSLRLHLLKTDNDNLERFAREEYYMQKNNEDIFIIKEKK